MRHPIASKSWAFYSKPASAKVPSLLYRLFRVAEIVTSPNSKICNYYSPTQRSVGVAASAEILLKHHVFAPDATAVAVRCGNHYPPTQRWSYLPLPILQAFSAIGELLIRCTVIAQSGFQALSPEAMGPRPILHCVITWLSHSSHPLLSQINKKSKDKLPTTVCIPCR